MRTYRQLTSEERYALSTLRKQGCSQSQIARALGRHRSTVSREVRRNVKKDRAYRPQLADDFARWRRSRSRRNQRFTAADWEVVETWLREDFSPEQVAGWLRRFRLLRITHETIYRHIWDDKQRDGTLHRHLRCAQKKRRKRYGRYDSRGRLAGKRAISERPPGAENRSRVGHLEGDTVLGTNKHCILTLVDRKTGYVMIAKLDARTRRGHQPSRHRPHQQRRSAHPLRHRRQWHRVPWLQGDRSSHRCRLLLRHPPLLLGARYQ